MPTCHSIEGTLDKDNPLGWYTHFKLSGTWIGYWLKDTLAEIEEGSEVRIVVEVDD